MLKAQVTKEKSELDIIKIKKKKLFVLQRIPSRKWRQPKRMGENICDHIFNKGLVSRINKELSTSTKRKIAQFKNRQKISQRISINDQ